MDTPPHASDFDRTGEDHVVVRLRTRRCEGPVVRRRAAELSSSGATGVPNTIAAQCGRNRH